MGSLNDYGRLSLPGGSKGPRRSWRQRLIIQTAGAVAFFLLVVACISGPGWLGQGARLVAGEKLQPASSWVDFNGAVGLDAPAPVTTEPVTPPVNTDSDELPNFTAPASGVVVTELAVAASGFPTEQGIHIQGTPGQHVKAAADGEVLYIGTSEDGYILELKHSGGFSSIYQGLSELSVGVGDALTLGQSVGVTEDGELTFTLLKDDAEVNPLEYLFQ